MQSTTVLTFVLVFMATLYVTTGDDQDCMCMCCNTDNKCTAPDLPMFSLPSCNDDSCKVQCVLKHGNYCTDAGTTAGGMCMSAASQVFNRYTTLGAFVLATLMLRI
jgi:hypothetical protein